MRAVRYTAAGGVIADGERVLVLHRPSRNEVRLPKGHVEAGESSREAALREAVEESGYTDLEIVADLGRQVVKFAFQGTHVIRDERYWLMRLRSPQQLERQPADLQFTPDWMSWDQAMAALSFEAEREWVRRAREQATSAPTETDTKL
jgi:8-oxo-dGTP pyrophosphatase MutT (NUDIX family)